MLADPEVDIVTICTPSGAHMEPAVEAAKAGKHVIVEKPREVTLKRCDKIIKACEKAGVTLATVFPSRFHESSQLLKKGYGNEKLEIGPPRRSLSKIDKCRMPFACVTTLVERGESAVCARNWGWQGVFSATG